MQVTARVTVTPCNPDLRETLDELLGLGFFSVGFSPMLASPAGSGEMDDGSLETMLDRMIACGAGIRAAGRCAGESYPSPI